MNLANTLTETWRGKDIYRVFMNAAAHAYTIRGVVVDVGSSTQLASYHRFLQKEPGATVACLDLGFESGAHGGTKIDLETSALPYGDNTVDTVLLFNVLEHIYRYEHLLAEIKRVLKPGGTLVGAVPFLVNYHPDPHDFWRFTKESLEKIFSKEGFAQISIAPFGKGPAVAAWSHYEQIVPRILKIVCVPLVLAKDSFVKWLRPKLNAERFPLGYTFTAHK